MAGSVETELKLKLVHADSWRGLMDWPGWAGMADTAVWRHDNLEAQYFDTPDGDLRQARLAYRIRRENGSWVAAVKGGGSSDGGLHQRSEWEATLAEPVPGIACFLDTPIGAALAEAVGDKPLVPLFTTCFERHTLLVAPDQDTVIEVAIDRGAILAGEQQEPLQEMELELKAGNLSRLLMLGADIAGDFPLLFEERSKYYRGLMLAGLAEKTEKRRRPAPDDGALPACEGARVLVMRALHAALREQARLTENREDPEILHQMRIKLRRLRAFLSFIRPLTQEAECREFQAVFREWGQMLGPTRETDVLSEAWREFSASGAVSLEGHDWLGEVLTAERRQQMEKIRGFLDNVRMTALFLRFWAWLAQDAWQEHGQQSFRAFCAGRLETWCQNLLEFGKEPDFTDMDNLHRLRIAGKKLRYVLENMEGAVDAPIEGGIDRLKQAQDSLGYLRDAHQTADVLARLLADKSSRALQRQAGLLTGWQARGAFEHRQAAQKTWRRLRKRLRKQLKKQV